MLILSFSRYQKSIINIVCCTLLHLLTSTTLFAIIFGTDKVAAVNTRCVRPTFLVAIHTLSEDWSKAANLKSLKLRIMPTFTAFVLAWLKLRILLPA